ncbi:hypothetical protein B0T25DRAFT_559628 [Lasiosphaeria hispida]|uniref:DUF4470 domain-containing protein n=1 Tax=Lasiosphaeria hispida TaxID=260671 RepID=A0AAJ0H793_9PEZI|nr:hypothetical protein B0T25DRAFT_559628 [Lasiosphaeria hispida]
MASQDATIGAEAARKRGNELYKKGDLKGAEVEYRKAATLAPNDPSPLSNLSSVKFELGQYAAAIAYIQRSLKLAGDVQADEAAVRKKKTLYERLAKCYMHESRFDDAVKLLGELSGITFRESVRSTLESRGLWRVLPDSKDELGHRNKVFDRLSRYQANLDDVPEYYAIGHDMAESLFDDSLQKSSSPQDSVSLMFCGSGDARNVFMTIIMFFVNESKAEDKFCKDIHITLLDLKPAAIARTLIFFDMMATYGQLRATGDSGADYMPIMMAYLYAGHVIPAAVNNMLQHHIRKLLDALETDKKIFDWFFIPPSTRREIVYVLRQWKSPPTANWHSSSVVRRTVRQRLQISNFKSPTFFMNDAETPQGLKGDRKVFDELAILLPSKAFANRHDPLLVALMEQYERGLKDAAKQLADHVDALWMTNLTLIDFDHAEALYRNGADEFLGWTRIRDNDMVPAIESDPVDAIAGNLLSAEGMGALESVGTFFQCAALPLTELSNRLKIEALVGEMTDIMDRLRWDCLDSRSQPSGGIDPSRFPRKYDRIHMSNIPDYIGGPFTATLYARPLLREDRLSNLRFTVLLNPPKFSSHEDFQAEYMLMHEMKHISDHFSVTRVANPNAGERDIDKMALLKIMMNVDSTDFMAEGYLIWERCPSKKLLRGKDMLPRPALEKWLHALFFKTCIPHLREKLEGSPVYSPLNLTALIRLICHLAEIGYPAHWLSGVLSSLCGGDSSDGEHMMTTARPPRSLVTTPADVDATYPTKNVAISPWRAEFTTLLSIWSPLMPFGFIATPGAMVSPADVAEFTVSFTTVEKIKLRVPHFVLLFWKSSEGKVPSGNTLWSMLREGKTRHDCLHIFTVMTYVTATQTASFWCRDDVMRRMKSGGWKVFIWRVDSWTQVTDGVKVEEGVVRKRSWDN